MLQVADTPGHFSYTPYSLVHPQQGLQEATHMHQVLRLKAEATKKLSNSTDTSNFSSSYVQKMGIHPPLHLLYLIPH